MQPAFQRLEGGTSSIDARLAAFASWLCPKRRAVVATRRGGAGAYYAYTNWEQAYSQVLDDLQQQLNFDCDLTFELITHRFTPGSKEVLLNWYPNTSLDMDEAAVRKNAINLAVLSMCTHPV